MMCNHSLIAIAEEEENNVEGKGVSVLEGT
jgi:hypothetical protein